MLSKALEFKRVPTYFITDDESSLLRKLRWSSRGGNGAKIGALSTLISLCQHSSAYGEQGLCNVTYEKLMHTAGVSRQILSESLKFLEAEDVIERKRKGRKTEYVIKEVSINGRWSKLPHSHFLLKNEHVNPVLRDSHNRSKVDLYALKLYLVILKFRDNKTSETYISHKKIIKYTGIPPEQVTRASSYLISNGVLELRMKRNQDGHNYCIYRALGLDSRRHNGTRDGLLSDDSIKYTDEILNF